MNDGQNLLSEALQRYLSGRYTASLRRQTVLSEQAWSAQVWGELADLGLLGAFLAERRGGLGLSPLEMMSLMETLGRHVVIEPFVSTAVVGGSLYSNLENLPVPGEFLGGSMRLALAADATPSGLPQAETATTADPLNGGYRLTGRKFVVRDAPSATHLIVSAKMTETGKVALFLVPVPTTRLSMDCYRLIDGAPAADLRFDAAILPASSLLAAGPPAADLLIQVISDATLAVCAEAVGLMRAMLEQTVSYTTQRKQFGVPLKSFQVLQHRMAEMYVEIEQACSSTHRAYSSIGDRRAVSAAKIRVNQALRVVSHESVQMHGAIGTTDDVPLSPFFRRAAAIERQYGSTAEHLQQFEQGLLQEILAASSGPTAVSQAPGQIVEQRHRASI